MQNFIWVHVDFHYKDRINVTEICVLILINNKCPVFVHIFNNNITRIQEDTSIQTILGEIGFLIE